MVLQGDQGRYWRTAGSDGKDGAPGDSHWVKNGSSTRIMKQVVLELELRLLSRNYI